MNVVVVMVLAWAVLVLLITVAGVYIGRKGPTQQFMTGKLSCPSCRGYFTPSRLKWEKTSKCLNNLDYCDECKRTGACGC